MNRDEVLDRLAMDYSVWPVAGGLKMRWTDNGNGTHRWSWVYMDDDEGVAISEWRERRIELGLDKKPDPEVTPEEDEAWNEARMDAIGLNGGEALHYDVTPVGEVEWSAKDTGAHYRYEYRANVTQGDADRGYVSVKLDPYRICSIYETGGGPREHIVKKALRGTRKGDTERGLIKQLRDALDRWEEMLEEDGQ